jgi:hypothetical protein
MDEEKEQPIWGTVFHCEKMAERKSYKVGLELRDEDFLMEPDKEKAEKNLDTMLEGMRRMFMSAWDSTRD